MQLLIRQPLQLNGGGKMGKRKIRLMRQELTHYLLFTLGEDTKKITAVQICARVEENYKQDKDKVEERCKSLENRWP